MFARIHQAMRERDEGFTLIELLVVIIIIGILAAIAIPVFLSQRQKGYDASVKSDLHSVATAEESYLTDHTSTYATASQLVGSKLISAISNGNTITVHLNGAQGYCLAGTNANHTGVFFIYDSANGGLQATTATSDTCSTTTYPTSGGSLTQTNGTLSTT